VRYDERGTGQSGGRPESASYEEFANDARAVVTYLSRRKDVDPKRISVIGYGEGGWISLLLAAREERVGAVALIGTPSIPGTELVVEQQKRMFERNGTPAASQQTAIDQQKAILDAVVSGKGWEALPPDVRRRVDTPLYKSFLTFDPSKAMVRVRQPMLILQPALDREVPAYHGEQLAQLARSRQKARGTDFVSLPSLNHLLVKSTTGEVAEYGSLPERSVSADAIVAISSWLEKALPAAPSK
jgi:pimeloyl-ACP methyl ester carboxylesterase